MSAPTFLTLHALRVKGFAKTELVAEISGQPVHVAERHLHELQDAGQVQFRETRSLWQLTPEGRLAHDAALADDVADLDGGGFAEAYAVFTSLNRRFQDLCGQWQLRNGAANDHTDTAYDTEVIARLVDLNAAAQPTLVAFGRVSGRFARYAPRLAETCRKVVDGETNMFTGVMCGSYHDVWMELHEDLILTQGIDRAREGSF